MAGMFEKNLQISYLLDFYGDILPERKRAVMESYYNGDLSLGEIADEMGVTRQAVRETVKKTEELLFFYEEKLGLLERFTETRERVGRVAALCEQMDSEDPAVKTLRAEIEALSEVVSD